MFLKLAGCDWIRQCQHLVIGGPTGTGKSWLACALGHKACREGFSVIYRRAPRLFVELATARGEGRLPRMLAMLERTRLLIIDDWGPDPLTGEQRRDLLEIVEDRYEKGSLLMTSQIPVALARTRPETTCPLRPARPTLGAIRPWITAGRATAQMESALRPPLPTATPTALRKPTFAILRRPNPGPLDPSGQAKHHPIDPRKQTPGGRHQIGTPAGFKSELVAGFLLECLAGFVGMPEGSNRSRGANICRGG